MDRRRPLARLVRWLAVLGVGDTSIACLTLWRRHRYPAGRWAASCPGHACPYSAPRGS